MTSSMAPAGLEVGLVGADSEEADSAMEGLEAADSTEEAEDSMEAAAGSETDSFARHGGHLFDFFSVVALALDYYRPSTAHVPIHASCSLDNNTLCELSSLEKRHVLRLRSY